MKTQNIDALFDKLFRILSSDRFLRKEGLGGEIPFFVQPYPPAQHTTVETQIAHLLTRLSLVGIEALEIHLYNHCMALLQEQGVLAGTFESEPVKTKADLFEGLQGALDLESVVVPTIKNKMETGGHHMVFLTGIGAAFPIIRSHTILNNLQKLIKQVPLIMFFPGEYNGITLTLFGTLKDDNYYRAFNLNDCKI